MITTCVLATLLVVGQMAPGQAGGDEISALVERVREGLARVDETLLSTLDADDARGLLDDAVRQHQEVIRALEELIRQAKYQMSNQGGGGGGGSSGGDPAPQQQGQQSQARESDGSSADQQEGGAQPPSSAGEEEQQDGGGEQSQEDQQSQGQDQSRPEEGGAGAGEGENRDGPPPPPEDKVNPLTATGDERWGLLPPKLQERLVNLHVDDVPPRYRDWLSAYIRAMRKVEAQEGP